MAWHCVWHSSKGRIFPVLILGKGNDLKQKPSVFTGYGFPIRGLSMVVRFAARLMALVMAFSLCLGTAMAQDIKEMSAKELDALIQKTTKEGRGVFINFFATWCPPCGNEIPMISKLEQKYGKKILFIGLSVDDKKTMDKVASYKKDKKIGYPVYFASRELVARYGVSSIPFNVGYGKGGKMEFAYAGLLEESELEDLTKDLLK